MTYAMAEMFSVPLAREDREQGAHHLERVMGLRSGRGGGERDVSDVSLTSEEWPTDIDALTDAVAAASPERTEFARRGVELAVAWMPALSSMFAAEFGASFTALSDIVAQSAEELTPETYALLFAIFISNGLERATDTEINDCLEVFYPETIISDVLDGRPSSDWDVVRRRLRPYQQLRFDRFRARRGGA